MSAGMIVLAVLGGIGIFSLLGPLLSGDSPFVLPMVLGLFFLVLVAVAIAWVRTRSDPAAFGIGRVITTTLSLAGCLVLCSVLVGAAAFSYLLARCAQGLP
jgi:hypothetical protein